MASASYITVADLYNAYDRRMIEQLSSDTTGAGALTSSNEKITTAIERASEDIQMAVTVGDRYSTDDLDTMKTDDRWALKGLVAKLAIGYLVGRRMDDIPNSVRDDVDEAKKTLDMLRKGERVFPVEASRTAGKGKLAHLSTGQRSRMKLVSDQPFFPPTRVRNY